ncbi:MAG: prepilin peptidase [Planctomycetota bacterium]
MTAIWWLLFCTALGLCVGSFLNVVIYRLPRNQSLRDPVWSCCPKCQHRIRWHDNLPVVSFVWLGGKCRDCRATISARYPVIEMLTAMVLLAVFDAFFVGRTRVGLCNAPYLTWALFEDWPIFLAHMALFACLLAMAAIDLREYWVDIRFTTVATWFGFALHTFWTPSHSMTRPPGREGWLRPDDPTAAGALGALVGLGAVWLFIRARCRDEPPGQENGVPGTDTPDATPELTDAPLPGPEAIEPADSPAPPTASDSADATAAVAQPARAGESRMGPVVIGLVLLGMLVSIGWDAVSPSDGGLPSPRGVVPVLMVFALILFDARVPRLTDRTIMDAIEAERSSARRMALTELALLLPAIGLGAVAVWLTLSDAGAGLAGVLHWTPGSSAWQPLYGLSTAAAGYVIGGGIGWAVRIVFTLLFGKEAFGLGDIHMMAAAGCVAGWPVVLLGFIVTIFVALFAWLVMLPFKRTRAIPLVPWLALGYLVVVIHYESLLKLPPVNNAIEVVNMLILDKSQPSLFGMPP